MKTRYFAFGCSYTYFAWATYADLIGANFDEFHNFGWGGSSNRHISNKVFEVNEYYDFNPETDFVTIMTTGFNRFSWFDIKTGSWNCSGEPDLSKYEIGKMAGFLSNMWNDEWAVYESYMSILSARRLLDAKGIRYKILKGLPFNYFGTDFFKVKKAFLNFVNSMDSMYESKESLHEFRDTVPGEEAYVFERTGRDGHPTIKQHLAYVERFLPEYYTDKTKEFATYCENTFIRESLDRQSEEWTKFTTGKTRFAKDWSSLLIDKNIKCQNQ